MSDFELILFVALIVGGFFVIKGWYIPTMSVHEGLERPGSRLALYLLPAACILQMLIVLSTLAAHDVVGSPLFIAFYLLLGLVWLGAASHAFLYLFDFSWRDDCLEANNPAAIITAYGAFFGLSLVYSGANIGDGPGWWCVVVAAGFGSLAWFLAFYLVAVPNLALERVLSDRDPWTATRLGLFLLAGGLILGRGAAGDYLSIAGTIRDFWVSWPILPAMALAWVLERLASRSSLLNNWLATAFIATIYLLGSTVFLALVPSLG